MPIKFDLAKYRMPVFVETGTYLGTTLAQALKAGFDKVYSIEIDDEYYNAAQQKFADAVTAGQLTLLHGDSAHKLPEIIKQETERCTFWLDAHAQNFNFDNNTLGEENCPLYWELDAIAKSNRSDHVIMIDDVRLLNNKNAWRGHNVTLEGVKERLKKINPDYNFVFEEGYIEDDVLVATTDLK